MASLIKTTRGKVPCRAIQFVNIDGDRKTIRIGKCGLEQARTFKQNVERLISCGITGGVPDVQLSAWLVSLPNDMHNKLAGAGLCGRRQPKKVSPTFRRVDSNVRS